MTALVAESIAFGTGARVVVIGGGIAGLTAAYRLVSALPAAEVVLLEREGHVGGKIVTERRDGFTIEGGPEGMHTAKPQAIALCEEIGLGSHLIGSLPAAQRTFVRHGGRLHALPEGLVSFVPTRLWPVVTTPLVSPRGKLRMGLDLVLPPRRDRDDESVGAFFKRRLGRQAFHRLIEPVVSGIYAGDCRCLSLAATFPHLAALEREHGGLIKGALAAKRRGAGVPNATRLAPFLSLADGLSELTRGLEERLRDAGVRIETGVCATSIGEIGRGVYEVTSAEGQTWTADAVICAAPAHAAASLLDGCDPNVTADLRTIQHASVATITLAYPPGAAKPRLAGAGYVGSPRGGRPVSACTLVSVKWPGRAPVGACLMRLSVGGAGRDGALGLGDEELVSIARAELQQMLGVDAPPLFARVFRWPQAMPQYELGHLERVAAIESRLTEHHPGLVLAGSSYRGVSLADCVQSGTGAADHVCAFLAATGRTSDAAMLSVPGGR